MIASAAILVAIWSIFVWALATQNAYHTVAGEERAASYDGGRQTGECGRATWLFDPCSPTQPSAEGDAETAEYDLAAQNKMADWAAAMVGVSGAGFLASVVGIILLRQTLIKTAEAVDAARDQIATTERFSKVQLRAYISVEPRGIRNLQRRQDIGVGWVGIRNVGHVPARAVAASVHLRFFPTKNQRPESLPVDVLSPATDRIVQLGVEILMGSRTRDEISIKEYPPDMGDGYVFVWGIVTYYDGFSEKVRYTAFCHRYNTASRAHPGNVSIEQQKARYHEVGNDAD